VSRLFRILPAILIAAITVGPVSAAPAISAQQVIAQASVPAAAAASVNGTVTDTQGAPVAGATVALRGPAQYGTTTDQKGAFAVAGITPGLYALSVNKGGYNPTTQPELALAPGSAQTLAIVLQVATLSSLKEIGSVTTYRRGTFNTSTASVANITAQTFVDQSQPQVMRILNQTPGIVASLPQTSANGAAPGAITFPNIRGALSFETASLIDGHPMSVGTFGDYVTTFLNSYALGSVEVVKGPGAAVPETNYAIGGTVNFRTKEPTFKPSGSLTLGTDNFGGNLLNAMYSGTSANGKFGWVLDYATDRLLGGVNNYQASYDGGLNGAGINGGAQTLAPTISGLAVPGTSSTIFNAKTSLFVCCQTFTGRYQNNSELVKLRYKLSPVTALTATYLGSQTNADQLGNTSSQIAGIFAPGASYVPGYPAGPILLNPVFGGGKENEINNEPIFQAELRSALKRDNILARAYVGTIDRLLYQGNPNPSIPEFLNVNVYGTAGVRPAAGGPAVPTAFNGAAMPVGFYNYFNQTEEDTLRGYSFEYDHFLGDTDNTISLAYDNTRSTTVSFSASPNATFANPNPATPLSYSVTIPAGSSQTFGTLLLRGKFNLGTKWNATLSEYFNTYKNVVAIAGPAGGGVGDPTGAGDTFGTFNSTHNDWRAAFEFRPNPVLALRASAGTAIAPPYLFLLTSLPFPPSFNASSGTFIQSVKSPGLLPETAFGFDLGGDWRLNDGLTVVSGDVYSTNLYNQFITALTDSGTTFTQGANTAELFYRKPLNLDQARYQGIELAVKRNPAVGLGFTVQGALQRGYVASVPSCFYATAPPPSGGTCNYGTNLAVIPGNNFTGGGLGFNGVSNQNVPYSQGYGELRYQWPNTNMFLVGMTYYGNNNSLNERPFMVGNASYRFQLAKELTGQLSADNWTNTYGGLFPLQGAGIPVPLANNLPTAGPNPPFGATNANVIGPATVRFTITKYFNFGGNP